MKVVGLRKKLLTMAQYFFAFCSFTDPRICSARRYASCRENVKPNLQSKDTSDQHRKNQWINLKKCYCFDYQIHRPFRNFRERYPRQIKKIKCNKIHNFFIPKFYKKQNAKYKKRKNEKNRARFTISYFMLCYR